MHDVRTGQTVYVSGEDLAGKLIGKCVVGIAGGVVLGVLSDGTADTCYSGTAGVWIQANCATSTDLSGIWDWLSSGNARP